MLEIKTFPPIRLQNPESLPGQRKIPFSATRRFDTSRSFLQISTMDGHDSDVQKQSTADMTAFVQNLLQQMQSRFQTMCESIITKIDDMGNRIGELEQSITDLRAEMGIEGSPSPVPVVKVKHEEGSA